MRIDVNIEKKYLMADLKQSCFIDDYFSNYKQKEKAIEAGIKEFEELRALLDQGVKEYSFCKYEIIGGDDEDSIRNYAERQKRELDYNSFLKSREKRRTKELLNEIDQLSLAEIREKYFAMEEVIENE